MHGDLMMTSKSHAWGWGPRLGGAAAGHHGFLCKHKVDASFSLYAHLLHPHYSSFYAVAVECV